MTNILASLGSFTKAVARTERLPFARNYGGGGAGLGYIPNGIRNITNIPTAGAGIDYDALVGDPLSNSVVARCVECIANALPDAPPYLEQRRGSEWERVDEHPVLDLLRRPNPFHSDADVWGLTVSWERTRGDAYWFLAWDETEPREIWVNLKPEQVVPLGTEEEFISGYRVTTEGGRVMEVGNDKIIHFRHMVNPWNAREGWTPIETGKRQIAGDNAAASYHASILRNSGVLSLLIAIKEGAASGTVAPEQIDSFVKALQRKLFGEGAGGIAGLNLPLDVHRMSYSPDEMALDKLISYYETRICVLMGVDPMVAGVGSGTAQKTYANLSEALNDFWERTIVPMHNRHASVLTAQLLPLFGLDAKEWRLRFDYSQVAALQENQDALYTRVGQAFQRGVIDLWTAQTALHITDVPEEYRGVFYKPPQAPQPQEEQTEGMEQETKALPEGATFDDYMNAALAELDAAAGGDREAQAKLIGEALDLSDDEMKALLEAEQERS